MEDEKTDTPGAAADSCTPERLSENVKLEADSEGVWVPGEVEVVFGSSKRSGLRDWDFDGSELITAYSEVWTPQMKELLQRFDLINWGPSFPLSYPWSKETTEELQAMYERAGRDRFVTFHFPEESELLTIAAKLEDLPEINRATPVPRIRPACDPINEPRVGTDDQLPISGLESQWYLFRCGINKAWAKASGEGVVIADVDWGFNPTHQDLYTQIKKRKNTFANSGAVSSGTKLEHGTAALGLAGAAVNGLGMAGVAHRATLWAIQAGSSAVENHKFWVSAIDFVIREKSGARKVLILELQTIQQGNVEMINTINKAIVDAICAGVIVCVPAGNTSGDADIGDDHNPIPPTGSILVGATKYHSQLNQVGSSKTGKRIVVYAPGDEEHDLTCDVPSQAYTGWFGATSGAVAKVAGVAALMLSVNKVLNQAEICHILKMSQIPVVDSALKQVGVLLNAEQAVCEALKLAVK